jgi:hypothetical protein
MEGIVSYAPFGYSMATLTLDATGSPAAILRPVAGMGELNADEGQILIPSH